MTFRQRSAMIVLLALAWLPGGAAAAVAQERRDFSIHSYYGFEFEGRSSDVGLLAFVGIQNITRNDFRDVVVTFAPAEPLTMELGPEELRRRHPGTGKFADRIEDGTYIYERPFLGKGQTLTVFYRLTQKNLLRESRRLLVFPKVEIAYSVDQGGGEDERRTYSPLYADEYRIPFDSFRGTVDSFLSRHADLSVRLTKCLPDRRFRFMKPVNVRHDDMVVGVGGSSDGDGFFRIQTGFPGAKDRVGNLQEILAYWELQERADAKPGPEMLREALEEAVKWLGSAQNLAFAPEDEPEETRVLRERAWAVSGTWHDPEENRLGKGRFRFYAFDVIKNIERDRIKQTWFLLLRTQANSSGLAFDQPDADAVDEAEVALLDELIGCFERR